jgi:pilus assembly protein Flp/PilA
MKLPARLRALVSDQRGQGLAEYALILALIAIVSILALIFLGTQISTIIWDISNNI